MGELSVKRRVLPYGGHKNGSVHFWVTWPGNYAEGGIQENSNELVFSSLDGIQITESEGHPDWRYPRKWGRFNGDIGGEFYSKRLYVPSPPKTVHTINGSELRGSISYNDQYRGPFLPTSPANMSYPIPEAPNRDSLAELGTTAIARCSPSNPVADVSTFAGELVKEGLPRLLGNTLRSWRGMNARERRKAIADEHLNYQFGWKPLVSELLDISKGIIKQDAIISQYERDSGKLVRRGFGFEPVIESRKETVGAANLPWLSPSDTYLWDHGTDGRVVMFDTTTTKTWFRGAFTYYLPPRDGTLKTDMARTVILAKKTLGLRLTPDVIWNLAPWSWAIDWFSNIGDFSTNVDNWIIDGQVLAYGYIMQHVLHERTYAWEGPTGLRSGSARPDTITLVTETKTRHRATPYGFGKDMGALSATQLSIIAALGISKSHGKK